MPEPISVHEETRFPVLRSVPLKPVARRPFRRPARTANDIPEQLPGTVLIARHNDAYEMVQRGTRLTDPILVDATSLLLVSVQRALVETAVVLPAAEQLRGIQIRARFQCRVTDALLLLRGGGWDVEPFLVELLLGSARLRMECLQPVEPATWYRFQQRIIALLIAHGEINALQLPGLAARLTDAQIALVPLVAPEAVLEETIAPSADPTPDTAPGATPAWPAPPDEPDHPLLRDSDPEFNRDNYRWDETK
jgi:hypothetical protein